MRQVTFELLGKAGELARERGGHVVGFLAGGPGIAEHAESLAAHGADVVYVADDARLEPYTTDAHAAVLAAAIRTRQPAAVLVPSTVVGRDLAPRVAAVLKKRAYMLAPLLVLIAGLAIGYTPMRSAAYAILLALLIAPWSRGTRLSPWQHLELCVETVRITIGIIAAVAAAGILIGVLTLTGLALQASSLILAAGGDSLFLVLLLTMIAIRTRKEEENLVARFGEAYRAYMERTGRFLPRRSRTHGRPRT